MKILVIGASGMLGNAVMRLFANCADFNAVGTVRSERSKRLLPEAVQSKILVGIDATESDALVRLFSQEQPDIVINCVGLVKQLATVNDPLVSIPLNSLFPHRLARLCSIGRARLIHISTDCVFSGSRGAYRESDPADARDLYGLSKFLGEVDYANAITIRTSIIGRSLDSSSSLIDWFLGQSGPVKGYKRAVFSGLPTVEIANIIKNYILPRPDLRGVYHVSSDPIDKYSLLKLVSEAYQKNIVLIPDENIIIDRSLDSSKFRHSTGFSPKSWPELIVAMKEFG